MAIWGFSEGSISIKKKGDLLEDIQALIDAIELRDIYTKGHSQRVASYAKEFGSVLKLNKKRQEELYVAGILHDLGKVGIPDQVLLKPGALDKDEYKLIQYHSNLSSQIVSKIQSFAYLAPIIKAHHENWDGSGYPDGLEGEEIPFEARILSLCDVFDALTTPRIYRQALPVDVAINILKKEQHKFDPNLFEPFIAFVKKRGIIKQDFKNLEQEILNQLRDNIFFHDPLTKLLNREGLLAIIKKSGDCEKFYGSLILINIKHFKEYNKEFGLTKGDLLLKKISQILRYFFKTDLYNFFPKEESYYIGRTKADNFILFYIGHKLSYLEVKIQKMIQEIKDELKVDAKYEFLLEHKNLKNNIKNIGYLI